MLSENRRFFEKRVEISSPQGCGQEISEFRLILSFTRACSFTFRLQRIEHSEKKQTLDDMWRRILMFYLLILAAAATRLFPHPPNVACIGAVGLFAGCYLSGKRAYLVPLAALLLSDIAGHMLKIPGMGFYQPLTMASVYLGAVAAVPVGRWLSSRKQLWFRAPAGSLMASTAFFLISNFGVWLGGWYTFTLAGFLSCYINAIPFFGYTLAGDLLFTGVLFGSFELSKSFSLQRSVLPHRA